MSACSAPAASPPTRSGATPGRATRAQATASSTSGPRVELDEKAVQKEIREKRAAFEKEHGKPRPGQPGPFPWRTVVQARRYAAHVPQTLVVKFADGTAETLPWPEDERWHRWVLER